MKKACWFHSFCEGLFVVPDFRVVECTRQRKGTCRENGEREREREVGVIEGMCVCVWKKVRKKKK